MTDDILDSRGRFWSAKIGVPDGQFAPEDSVTGRLRVRPNGRAELDLDGTISLSRNEDPMDRMFSQREMTGAICGFLIDANKHVRLTELTSNGVSYGAGSHSQSERDELVRRDRVKPSLECDFAFYSSKL